MLKRLDLGEKGDKDPEQARRELDQQLKVKRWRITPQDTDPYADVPVDEGAPWWWDGDEEASDTFLQAQGIDLGGDGS